ncbi:hypothetical protein Cni_G01079 [Canna indica]|uniref:Uncharacterized protein n=1 Tax=Canna indica TaxID=4628 RepID=A0AAQ3JM29_9LILI|nr:hypothetical protein Cni_G01079 [Canna indica]
MRASPSRFHSVNQPTRRSPRLKKLSAFYEAKNGEIIDISSEIQKCDKEDGGFVTKQIKVEMLESEDDDFTCQSSDNTNALPDSASDELAFTLKDLRERCKIKNRKSTKSNSPKVDTASNSSYDKLKMQNHDHVEVKQEESDLEEPLINLKLNRSKRSTANSKRRKTAHISSVPFVSKEGTTRLPSSMHSDDGQSLSLIVKDNRTNKDEIPEDQNTFLDLKTTKETHILELGNSLTPSDTCLKRCTHGGDVPELVHCVKSEIIETSLLDYQMEDNNSISGNSSAILLQKDEQYICPTLLSVDKGDQTSLSASELEKGLHVNCPIHIFKDDELETDTQMDRHTFPSTDSTVRFTGKLHCSQESSNLQLGSVNEDIMGNDHLTPIPSNSQLCVVNEVSTIYREPENYGSLPENSEEHTSKMDPMPNQDVLPSVSDDDIGPPFDCCDHKSIPALMNTDHANISVNKRPDILPEDIRHEQMAGEINCPAISHGHGLVEAEVCTANKANKESHDLANGTCLQEMPIYIQPKDVTDEHNLLCKEVYGLEEIFLCGKENQCRGDLIRNAVPRHMLCPMPLSKPSSSINELHRAHESSAKTEFFAKLEDTLNDKAHEITHFSDEISSLANSDGVREIETQSPREAFLSVSARNVLQHSDDNSMKDVQDLCGTGEEKFDATLNQPTITSISHAIDRGIRQPELDHDFFEDHSPKKLLSNRKTISPTSQEKLYQALSDIHLDDVSQVAEKRKRLSIEKWTKIKKNSSVSGHKEVDLFLEPEQTNKKARNNSDVPLAAKKVTPRSPEASGRRTDVHMEKAIEFSQRQLHDIEKVVMQLLQGLSSMKTIVEETLTLQAYSSLPSKFTAEEIKSAFEDASELEKTAKRWLSMMTRDCNRFCKIMKSADKSIGSVTPVNGVVKERKITFADEVGGMLCHVKVFEQQQSPATVPESEQAGR